jgi:hypothetical protein
MESTRSIYTCGNYSLEKKEFDSIKKWRRYPYAASGRSFRTSLPIGGNAPPSKLSREDYSDNSTDIESYLFKLNPYLEKKPIKKFNEISFFKKEELIMPEPLIIEKNQRIYPLN